MALIVSAASGNFNAGATWVGGVVPGVGDEAQAANGHTITITANATCTEISNAGTGKFVLNSGVTLTANVTHKSATATTNCLEFSQTSPATSLIVGNCTGGLTSASQRGVVNLSTGKLQITGTCIGGQGNFNYGALNNSTGIIEITGVNGANACIGGTGPTAEPVGVANASTGTIDITGNCTAGSGPQGYAVLNKSSGAINIIGNVTASVTSGAFQSSTGTLSVIGTLQSSQTAAAVAGANVQQNTILSGPFLTETVRGVAPVYCAAWRWNASPSNSTYMEVMTNNLLAKRNLVTADNITGMPAASNVKSGIAYGPSSELTGTFSQTVTPSTADIATAVWGAATRSITGGTVDTLTNAPASVTPSDIWSHSSRTITGGTVDTLTNAPSVPSASAIASQVRTELATELARVDQNISSRLASSAYTAPANSDIAAIKSKTDNLPASPAATGDIPSANITAIKAKTDLLVTDRLAQCSTVATTGAQLAAALS